MGAQEAREILVPYLAAVAVYQFMGAVQLNHRDLYIVTWALNFNLEGASSIMF